MSADNESSFSVVCCNCSNNLALVFCHSDGVFLCNSCDKQVHSVNKIAERHVRVPYYCCPVWAYKDAKARGRITEGPPCAPAFVQGHQQNLEDGVSTSWTYHSSHSLASNSSYHGGQVYHDLLRQQPAHGAAAQTASPFSAGYGSVQSNLHTFADSSQECQQSCQPLFSQPIASVETTVRGGKAFGTASSGLSGQLVSSFACQVAPQFDCPSPSASASLARACSVPMPATGPSSSALASSGHVMPVSQHNTSDSTKKPADVPDSFQACLSDPVLSKCEGSHHGSNALLGSGTLVNSAFGSRPHACSVGNHSSPQNPDPSQQNSPRLGSRLSHRRQCSDLDSQLFGSNKSSTLLATETGFSNWVSPRNTSTGYAPPLASPTGTMSGQLPNVSPRGTNSGYAAATPTSYDSLSQPGGFNANSPQPSQPTQPVPVMQAPSHVQHPRTAPVDINANRKRFAPPMFDMAMSDPGVGAASFLAGASLETSQLHGLSEATVHGGSSLLCETTVHGASNIAQVNGLPSGIAPPPLCNIGQGMVPPNKPIIIGASGEVENNEELILEALKNPQIAQLATSLPSGTLVVQLDSGKLLLPTGDRAVQLLQGMNRSKKQYDGSSGAANFGSANSTETGFNASSVGAPSSTHPQQTSAYQCTDQCTGLDKVGGRSKSVYEAPLITRIQRPDGTFKEVDPERAAQLYRYRHKRMLRLRALAEGQKKIRYECRKVLADSRVRIKGRFAKISSSDELATIAEHQAHSCQTTSSGHCPTSSSLGPANSLADDISQLRRAMSCTEVSGSVDHSVHGPQFGSCLPLAMSSPVSAPSSMAPTTSMPSMPLGMLSSLMQQPQQQGQNGLQQQHSQNILQPQQQAVYGSFQQAQGPLFQSSPILMQQPMHQADNPAMRQPDNTQQQHQRNLAVAMIQPQQGPTWQGNLQHQSNTVAQSTQQMLLVQSTQQLQEQIHALERQLQQQQQLSRMMTYEAPACITDQDLCALGFDDLAQTSSAIFPQVFDDSEESAESLTNDNVQHSLQGASKLDTPPDAVTEVVSQKDNDAGPMDSDDFFASKHISDMLDAIMSDTYVPL